jgi:hypothetical protein
MLLTNQGWGQRAALSAPLAAAQRFVANRVRYVSSGIYFARATVGGKLIRHSLSTRVHWPNHEMRKAHLPFKEARWRTWRLGG